MSPQTFTAPAPLVPGDRIRVVAPCGPFRRASLAPGIACLRDLGFEVVHDDGVFACAGYLAGDDDRRRRELLAALDDDDNAAIWVARGGYGATRLLPSLPLTRLARRPRWLVGFSDATALHAAWQRAGLASIHAANVTTLSTWAPAARAALLDLLGGGTGAVLAGTPQAGSGSVTAPVLGGNVALVTALIGTGHLPALDGAILLVEDIHERPYRLDRMLTQLLHSGLADRCAGVAIGQLTDCDDGPDGDDPRRGLDVVLERLSGLGVPMVSGLPIGHDRDAWPVPLGLPVTLDADAGTVAVAPRP